MFEWIIKTVVRPTDLRTISWQANNLHYISDLYKLKVGEAVLFVNKPGDKARILVKNTEQVHTLVMLPVDPKGYVWGDRFNAALVAGQWVEQRVNPKRKNACKTISEWLDELSPKSDRVREYHNKKRRA